VSRGRWTSPRTLGPHLFEACFVAGIRPQK
jgi:hypothetical protein